MGCKEREPKLTDWVLNELPPAEAQELERHVEQCAECAGSVRRLREVHGRLTQGLTDLAMPARLLFLPDTPRGLWAPYWSSLWRAAAVGAVAGVVFLVVSWAGLTYRGARLAPPARSAEVVLTRAEVKVLAAQVVSEQLAVQRREDEAAHEKLANSLREETMGALARSAQQVAYLQSVQSAVWERTEQQNALVQLIARNSLERGTPQAGKP